MATSNLELVPIYTDWANRHLAKTSTTTQTRPIRDISNDFRDYRLITQLINVIVPVNKHTTQYHKKLAKTTSNLDGLDACLDYLQAIGLDCTKLTKTDIDSGNLGAVLQLLYLLSTFKQKLRQLKKDQKALTMPPQVSKLPSPQQKLTTQNSNFIQQQNSATMTSRLQPPTKLAMKTDSASKVLKPKGSSGIKPPSSSTSSLRSSSRASGNNNVTLSNKSLDSSSSIYSTISSSSSLRPPTQLTPKTGQVTSSSSGIRQATTSKISKIAAPKTTTPSKLASLKKTTTQPVDAKESEAGMLKLKLFGKTEKGPPAQQQQTTGTNKLRPPTTSTSKISTPRVNYRTPSTTAAPTTVPPPPQKSSTTATVTPKKEKEDPTAVKRCSKSSEEESGYVGFGSTTSPASSSTDGSFSMHSASSKGSSSSSSSSVKSPSSDELTIDASTTTTIRQKSVEEKPILAVKGEIKTASTTTASSKIGVVSPMMTHKKFGPPPTTNTQKAPTKGAKNGGEESAVAAVAATTAGDEIPSSPIIVVPPQMAPIRHQPPTYDQLLKQGRITSPVKSAGGYVDSSTSEDSLSALTVKMAPPTSENRVTSSTSSSLTRKKEKEKENGKSKTSESSGYASEGGYAAFAKMREKLKEYDDMTRRAQEGYPDNFEDSSSLSSGISDNIEFDDISTSDLSGVDMATVAKHTDYSHFVRSSAPSSHTKRSISSHHHHHRHRSPSTNAAASTTAHSSRTILEQENIHKLLSQCRTSQRGAAAATPPTKNPTSAHNQYSLKSPGYATFSPHLTVSADQHYSIRRPTSSASHKPMYSGSSNGFHSLDRKTHLHEFSTPSSDHHNRMAALLSPRRCPPQQSRPPTASAAASSIASMNASGMSRSMVLLETLSAVSSPKTSKRQVQQQSGSQTSRRSHSPRIPLSIASSWKGSSRGVYADGIQLYRLADEKNTTYSARSEMGSQLSLASTTAYGSTNEKYEHAIQEMSRDLEAYQMTIDNLTRKQENYGMMFEMFEKKLRKLTTQIDKANLKADEQIKLKHELANLREISTRLHSNGHVHPTDGAGELLRQPSLESVASHRSSMSSSSKSSKQEKMSLNSFGKTKKSWIRSSLSKLTKKKSKHYGELDSMPTIVAGPNEGGPPAAGGDVTELRQELRNRENALTEVRLDALDRAREVDVLKEAVHKLKTENKQLKKKVDLLTNAPSRASSQASLPFVHDDEHVYDAACSSTASSNSKRSSGCNSLKVTVNVDLVGEISKVVCPDNEIIVGYLTMPTANQKTTWQEIDTTILSLFDTYLQRIDTESQLDLTAADAILGYQIGDLRRQIGDPTPPGCGTPNSVLTPSGTVRMFMKGARQHRVDSLVLDTLLPRQMVHQLVKYTIHQRRLVLAGAAGIGKSKLAKSLADYVARRFDIQDVVDIRIPDGSDPTAEEELLRVEKTLESHLRVKTTSSILILDNIPKHRIAFVAAVFANVPLNADEGPFVLCTVNRYQIPEMQINQNFKMFLLTNRMEGVNGFMLRFLRRRTVEAEYRQLRQTPSELMHIIQFLPEALAAVNQFIERTNSIDVTIGPRVFLQCPLSVDESRRWFIRLWNDNFVPYMERVAREGKKTFGRSPDALEDQDPTDVVSEKWPWMDGPNPEDVLKRLSNSAAEDANAGGGAQKNGRSQFNPLESLIQLHATKHSTIENI